MEGFAACFADLDDPRSGNAARHKMLEMLVIALCSVLTGGDDCTDMAEFAETRLDFLRGFLELKHGAPSHDTFSRLFRLLDPEQFRTCFQRFMTRFAEACQGVEASDGKVLPAPSTQPPANRHCTWFPPGPASSNWCSGQSPPRPSRMRSPPCRSC